MVEFPLHPGLTRTLLKAAALGCQDLLLPVAAMLSVENIFIRPGQHCSSLNYDKNTPCQGSISSMTIYTEQYTCKHDTVYSIHVNT